MNFADVDLPFTHEGKIYCPECKRYDRPVVTTIWGAPLSPSALSLHNSPYTYVYEPDLDKIECRVMAEIWRDYAIAQLDRPESARVREIHSLYEQALERIALLA